MEKPIIYILYTKYKYLNNLINPFNLCSFVTNEYIFVCNSLTSRLYISTLLILSIWIFYIINLYTIEFNDIGVWIWIGLELSSRLSAIIYLYYTSTWMIW